MTTKLQREFKRELDLNGEKYTLTVTPQGFKLVPKGRVTMPGPVDAARILVFELVDGAFEGVSGVVAPDWSKARG